MKKKNNKDDEKKPIGGSPPIEPIKPNPTSGERVSFSYQQLVWEDFFISDNRRFARFFLDAETPAYLDIQYGLFIDYQLSIWEATNKIVEASKEGEEVCTCNNCQPEMELVDHMEIHIAITDPDTKEVANVTEMIPIYIVYDMSNLKVGNQCNTKKLKK